MLMLLFYAGDTRYAMPGDNIVEVIPNVELVAVPAAPPHVIGMLPYGGTSIPVLDFCLLVQGELCQQALHTRIIVIQGEVDGQFIKIGLRAEKVTEVFKLSPQSLQGEGVVKSQWPFLGAILTDEKTLLQLVDSTKLLEFYLLDR